MTETVSSPVSNALSPTMKRWRVKIFTATWLSYAGYYFCRKAYSIVKSDLKDHLQINDLELAHIGTAFFLTYMLGQFLTAYLGRKIACRRLLLVGMGVSLVANIVFGFLYQEGRSAYTWMIIFMGVNGLAQATGWPGNIGILAKWTQRSERGTVIGFWATCYQLGSGAAKMFASLMLALLGPAWSFWGASGILLIVWFIFYLYGQEQPEDVGLSSNVLFEVVEVDVQNDPTAHAQHSQRTFWSTVIAMGLCYFCFKFLRYSLDSWSPMIIEERFSRSTAMAGVASSLFDWIGFGGVVIAGIVSDRWAKSLRTPVIFIMSIGMLLSVFMLAQVNTQDMFLWFLVFLGLTGFMLYGPDSLLSGTAAMDVGTPAMAVIASGVINGLGSIGPIVQEEVVGYVKTYYGLDAVFNLFIIVAALGVLGTGLLWYTNHRMGTRL